METTKNKAKRPPAQKKPQPKKKVALDERQQPQASQKRRVPGAAVKQPPQKAPHAKPRKNAPVQEPVRVTPEVVYLAPKPFSRNRLLLRLATVVAVVLALVVGLSLFFKVENIQVSGCEQYTAYQIQQASGISEGDQLLTFSRAKASGKIISALPYVKTVRIGISLPDTVYIEIVETKVTYEVADKDGGSWLLDSDGKVVSAGNGGDHTKILGVQIENPAVGEIATAYQHVQTETDADGNVIPVTVTQAQKLQAAVSIAKLMEKNGIIGQAATIDVNNIYKVEVWYADIFQVMLGDTSRLDYKVTCMAALVQQLLEESVYATGLIDVSDPDKITYQSFTG